MTEPKPNNHLRIRRLFGGISARIAGFFPTVARDAKDRRPHKPILWLGANSGDWRHHAMYFAPTRVGMSGQITLNTKGDQEGTAPQDAS